LLTNFLFYFSKRLIVTSTGKKARACMRNGVINQ
jgi:hypothetical protein